MCVRFAVVFLQWEDAEDNGRQCLLVTGEKVFQCFGGINIVQEGHCQFFNSVVSKVEVEVWSRVVSVCDYNRGGLLNSTGKTSGKA